MLYGRSLGGAVAIAVASANQDKIVALMLENTFCSISLLVDKIFPFLRPIKKYLLRLDWNSIARIPSITAPILFISGRADEVVPYQHMDKLIAAATSSKFKKVVEIEDGTHNDTWIKGGLLYVQSIRYFLYTRTPAGKKICEPKDVGLCGDSLGHSQGVGMGQGEGRGIDGDDLGTESKHSLVCAGEVGAVERDTPLACNRVRQEDASLYAEVANVLYAYTRVPHTHPSQLLNPSSTTAAISTATTTNATSNVPPSSYDTTSTMPSITQPVS